jgi:DnaJ-class molecular chaperone
LRLPGRGLPKMKGDAKGDLFVTVSVDVPSTLTEEQEKLVRKLATTGM